MSEESEGVEPWWVREIAVVRADNAALRDLLARAIAALHMVEPKEARAIEADARGLLMRRDW